ncbi:MAG TPA: histidine kinase [Candidatus Limnocylindrales bacterium]|nr:histidine kinase [Candidatus Limnocylindrales bacterium]
MTGGTVRLIVGVIGTILALAGEAVALQGGREPAAALLHLAIGLTYLHGGLAIWNHEPANRTGRLMTLVGLTWFIGTLDFSGILFVREVGLAFEDTFSVVLLALVLAYPSGRLETRVDRLAVATIAIGATALNLLYSTSLPLLADKSNGLYGGLALAAMTTIVVVRRWVVAGPRARRDLLPVLIAGLVFLATMIINIVRRIAEVPDEVAAVLIAAKDLAPAAIPIALLIGFYRQSERRLKALVDALPDRMFRFGPDGRYVPSGSDTVGSAAADPAVPSGRRLYELTFAAAGERAVGAASRALRTGELQAFDFSLDLPAGPRQLEVRIAPSGPDEVTAIVRDFTDQRSAEAELRRSRARIVEAADDERRRLERDLHDGAQQRLVSLSLALRLLRGRLGSRDGPNGEAIVAADEAAAELKVAIKELRELARGIHPAILTEAGLGAAMTALAERSAVPATVGSLPDRRLPAGVEATAYFVVSEALANIAKYAGATKASVAADLDGRTLRVEVGDDGVGGADSSRGTGLRGLQDRVAAIGGRLAIDSPAGQGTLLVAEIPVD